jgi:hypothetical protein
MVIPRFPAAVDAFLLLGHGFPPSVSRLITPWPINKVPDDAAEDCVFGVCAISTKNHRSESGASTAPECSGDGAIGGLLAPPDQADPVAA